MVATQIFFIFTPIFCEDSHFDSHFSDGLVQPPTTNQPMSSKVFSPWVYKSGLRKSQVNSIEGCLRRATNLVSTHNDPCISCMVYLPTFYHKFEPFIQSSHGSVMGFFMKPWTYSRFIALKNGPLPKEVLGLDVWDVSWANESLTVAFGHQKVVGFGCGFFLFKKKMYI